MSSTRSPLALAGFLAASGTLHFVRPKTFDPMVPRSLPGSARTWTHVSGAAEFGCSALLAHPKTRRFGGLATAGLFVAVFPANVTMALDRRRKHPQQRYLAYARLPLQIPLIRWALRVRANAAR